jgi:thiol-disulfide isomerase/thioredoxin
MAVDSIEKFFDLLSQDVKNSNVGYTVWSYAYPLSNNLTFKKANPLNGVEFNEKLASIRTVYDLTSSDSSGDIIDFNRFRGNYLYIDFWASWCVPCIKEMPALKNTIEIYKGEPIKFISVSVDTDEKKWKKAILDNNMYWLQASELTGFQGLVPTFCKVIIGVPQYVLVDKNGVIVSSDAPRPGTPELTSLLNSVLR